MTRFARVFPPNSTAVASAPAASSGVRWLSVVSALAIVLCLGIAALVWRTRPALPAALRTNVPPARAAGHPVTIRAATLPIDLPRPGLMDRILAKDHWDLSISRDPVASAVRSQVWSDFPEEMPPSLWPEIEQVSEVLSTATVVELKKLPLALDDPNLGIQIVRQQRATLAWHEELLGPAHPESLVSRRQLAVILEAQGQPVEAESELRAMLAIRVQVSGPAHADTLALRNDLATFLLRQRRAAEAENEYRTVLAIRERTLAADHPLTLSIANNLANAIDAQDRHTEAERWHRAVLAARERTLGREHPAVLQSCFNLAIALANQGKLEEAVEFSWRAEEGRKRLRIARPKHPGGGTNPIADNGGGRQRAAAIARWGAQDQK